MFNFLWNKANLNGSKEHKWFDKQVCILAVHLVRQTEDTLLSYPDSKITEE
jgi:hypothetical protein